MHKQSTILARELRNQLAPMCTAVEILHIKPSTSKEGKWAIDLISKQMGHLTGLVDDLLVLSDESAPKERLALKDALPKNESESSVPVYSFKILVVDDNEVAAESLQKLLSIMGNEARVAYDSFAAMEELERFRPDVVLLDIGLPDVDGYRLAKKIREQPWGKRMSLIAVTGWGEDDDKARSKEAGMDHHLVKPIGSGALLKLLGSIESSHTLV